MAPWHQQPSSLLPAEEITKIAQFSGLQFYQKSAFLCVEQFLFSMVLSHLSVSLFIITQVKQLAEKARAGKLAPNEFQGGTFRQATCACLPLFFREFFLSLKFHILTF